jgi:hypothetical protein
MKSGARLPQLRYLMPRIISLDAYWNDALPDLVEYPEMVGRAVIAPLEHLRA